MICVTRSAGGSDADRLGRDPRRIREALGHPGALPASHCSSQNPVILLRGVACQVTRPLHVLPGPVRIRRLAQVRDVHPLRGVAGILVVVDARDPVRVALRARVDEVPDAILPDRPAEGSIEVVDLRERGGRREAGVPELLREVVGLQILAAGAEVDDPCMALPPVFGTMFIDSPAVSDSPRLPDVVKVISWAFPMSAT